ncbi:hypothetical protein RD792_000333 [Penstemon davidsonii]|uniref:Uncharacterized protein n=1 Tax=Penstemon davidsonii TaxID=160366 RepID=A0ABR0DKD0_9LAMI|nr:hypothetical protein RD792_000333 [Penstemon davidsonii]
MGDGVLDSGNAIANMEHESRLPATNTPYGNTHPVARSPVLDRSFFASRGIRIPSYTVSLSVQMSWFKKYLNIICSTPTEYKNSSGTSSSDREESVLNANSHEHGGDTDIEEGSNNSDPTDHITNIDRVRSLTFKTVKEAK